MPATPSSKEWEWVREPRIELAQALDDSVELDESSDVEPGPEPSAAAEPGPEPCAEPGPKSQAQSVSEAIEQGLAKAPWNQSNSSQPQ